MSTIREGRLEGSSSAFVEDPNDASAATVIV
jgi:hypothetical protein